jgi:transcriptional regulator with XRE-family HTH domain
MPNVSRRNRLGPKVIAGRRRADALASRLGVALRDARQRAGLRQADVAHAAGLSQPRVGELERGLGSGASLETWALAAAAVGEQLVAFLELAPGATPPRDVEHLRRQAALIELASGGGWRAIPELALDRGAPRSRSIDVALMRLDRREAIVAEIWDWFDDVGASLRSLDARREALADRLAREHGGEWTIRAMFVVRRTRRNEQLIGDLRALFAARFPGSSRTWLAALGQREQAMPPDDGFLWSTATYRLQPSRLGGRVTEATPVRSAARPCRRDPPTRSSEV